jgi:ABC-type transporter Mla subunit MlaD
VASYLTEMLPQLPAVVHDLQTLGPVTQNFAAATPPLLSTLSNGSVIAQTITANATQLEQLLNGATPTANQLTALLVATQSSFEDLVANSAPLLGDIAANPNMIAQTLHGFDLWSKAYATAEQQGPYLSFAGDIVISGSVQVVAAALGLPGSGFLVEQGLGPQFFNPPPYSAADCPRYIGEAGPNCPPGQTAQTKAGPSGGAVPVVITQAQQRAAAKIATSLNNGKAPSSPAVTALLLEPLLVELAHGR